MKIVLQDGIKDCGICSLLSVIRYYGGDVSKEYLRELTNTTKSGVSAYKLIEGANKIGLTGIGVKGDLKNINKNNLPCLAHMIVNKSYQHFVVIYNIDYQREKVLIMDPAKGKKTLSFAEFKLLSSNNFIYLKPNKKLPVITRKEIVLDNIKTFIQKNLLPIILVTILSIIYFIINLVVAFHFKYLLEYAINYKIKNNLSFISIYLFLMYLVKEILFFTKNILLLKLINIFDYELTTKTYKRIILLPYLYYKNRTTGEVISRIKDLNIVKTYLFRLISSIITDLGTVLIFIGFMFNISYKLTISILLIISVIFIYNMLITKLKKKKITRFYHQEEKLNSYLIESLTSADSIKGLHIETPTTNKFRNRYKGYLSILYDVAKLREVNLFLKNVINNSLLVIIYGIGTILVLSNDLTITELFIYQSMLNYLLSGINNILILQSEKPEYKAALDRINDMYTIKKENFSNSKYYELYNLDGPIEYKNLTYSYTSSNLFNNLNLKIEAKSKVLISGKSGSGKSTLVKMLMRYIEIPYDNIKINHIDINHYHLDILRKKITYVTGSEFLFSDTIYNNIDLNRKIDKNTIDKVSKLVLLDEVVKKDKLKYEKIIEENGFNFSAGERQRIILARSLLKNSDIYIFDEALSQIDIERERKILKNIFKYLKDKTVIVISHRFNNEDLFEKSIKLEGGKIIENKKV